MKTPHVLSAPRTPQASLPHRSLRGASRGWAAHTGQDPRPWPPGTERPRPNSWEAGARTWRGTRHLQTLGLKPLLRVTCRRRRSGRRGSVGRPRDGSGLRSALVAFAPGGDAESVLHPVQASRGTEGRFGFASQTKPDGSLSRAERCWSDALRPQGPTPCAKSSSSQQALGVGGLRPLRKGQEGAGVGGARSPTAERSPRASESIATLCFLQCMLDTEGTGLRGTPQCAARWGAQRTEVFLPASAPRSGARAGALGAGTTRGPDQGAGEPRARTACSRRAAPPPRRPGRPAAAGAGPWPAGAGAPQSPAP